MDDFTGLWVPLITPFSNEIVDSTALENLAADCITAGVDGLVVAGTTGEGFSLSGEEQLAAFHAVQGVADGIVPVAIGIAGNDTRSVVDTVKRLTAVAPAAFLISAPHYVRPSQEGIRLHFEAILANTSLPVILCNVPARTGVSMSTETILTLAEYPQIVAIKQCCDELNERTGLLGRSSLKVLCGDDSRLLIALASGCHGAISAAAQIRPDLFVQMFRHLKKEAMIAAAEVFEQLLPLIQVLYSEPNPGPIKAALALRQQISSAALRLPMTTMSIRGQRDLVQVLRRLDQFPVTNMRAASSDKNMAEQRASITEHVVKNLRTVEFR